MRIARCIGGTTIVVKLKDVAYLDSKIQNVSVETKKFKNETVVT